MMEGRSVFRAIVATTATALTVALFVVVLSNHDDPDAAQRVVTSSLASGDCVLQMASQSADVNNALFGHNAINGPIYQVKYDDIGLVEGAKALWTGMLRYPGGTVADYWYWPNGSFVSDCKGNGPYSSYRRMVNEFGSVTGGGDDYDYDYCDKKQKVDAVDGTPFTIQKFNNGYGSASPVVSDKGHMYDLNVLTVDEDGIKTQLYSIKHASNANGFPVTFLEFGNEFFMSHFAAFFPTATEYMEKIKSSITLARELFPEVKIGVVFGFHFCKPNPNFKDWNTELAKYEDLFDAVTIHDYTACTHSVDNPAWGGGAEDARRSALAAWGQKSIDEQLAWVGQFFGSAKDIWLTEWSYASWVGVPLQGEAGWDQYKIMNQGITGIFHASFLLKMLESSQDTTSFFHHTASNHHIFNEQDGQGWGKGAGYVKLSKSENDIDGTLINGPGQMFSHIAYVAQHLSNQVNTVTPSSQCASLSSPGATFADNLSCLYATAFRHYCREGDSAGGRTAMPIYIIINRCTQSVYPRFDASTMQGTDNRLRVVTYENDQDGDWVSLSSITAPNWEHPWVDGPITPTITERAVNDVEVGSTVQVTIKALSLNIVEFKEPSIALANWCPSVTW